MYFCICFSNSECTLAKKVSLVSLPQKKKKETRWRFKNIDTPQHGKKSLYGYEARILYLNVVY
jgi:hypothetical protein